MVDDGQGATKRWPCFGRREHFGDRDALCRQQTGITDDGEDMLCLAQGGPGPGNDLGTDPGGFADSRAAP